jgi:hypothetical protein
MDVTGLSELVDGINYLLARISKFFKNNQCVYLRAFDSCQDVYNGEKFVKTISHQVVRQEEKINELDKAAEEKLTLILRIDCTLQKFLMSKAQNLSGIIDIRDSTFLSP